MIKSAYIHIPFCTHICSYCDFPKVYYHNCYIDKYLEQLKKEIEEKYKGEILETIYIGGGTPTSLNIKELEKLFSILNVLKKEKNIEFTIECNLENLDIEKLKLFKKNGVNRLSIGVETFNKRILKVLDRETFDTTIIEEAKKIGFDNINIDLIYAIQGQTIEDLKYDLDQFLKLDINHLSIYSLIIEPHTKLGITKTEPIDEELDYKMYKYIINYLKEYGFNHYEISNFSKPGYESKHNLVYWDNLEYYGFGMGASSYIDNKRITNTKSITKYLHGIYTYEIETINEKSKMEYEMILGLRKIKGINKKEFKNKYNRNIEDVFNIKKLIEEGKLIDDNEYVKVSSDYLYLSNEILINFVGVL